MNKFYKVVKENFLWEIGAVLKQTNDEKGYIPINDIYKKIEDSKEYISKNIIENCPEYFQRVYAVNLISKIVYKLKKEAKELIDKQYKS